MHSWTWASGRAGRHGGVYRSLVAHLVRDEGAGGSNPLTPTNIFVLNETAKTAVAGFENGELDAAVRGDRHGLRSKQQAPAQPGRARTLIVSICRGSALCPARSKNSPGSKTRFRSLPRKASAVAASLKQTVPPSPRRRAILPAPLSSTSGRATLASTSRANKKT